MISIEVVSQQLGFIVDVETGRNGFLFYVDITGSVGWSCSKQPTSRESRFFLVTTL